MYIIFKVKTGDELLLVDELLSNHFGNYEPIA